MPSLARALTGLRAAVERGRPDQCVPVRRWYVSALLTAYDLRVADVARARAVLREIDDAADECPICRGVRLRIGGEDGVWEEGEIEHRADCALEREKGE